jgi:iron complex transport system ATP-binding protein
MLTVRQLSFGYRGKPVVRDLSFSLAPGEVACLVGPNGAGKSTVIKLLTRVLKPQQGEVNIDGEETRAMPRLALARKLATLPQGAALPEGFTVLELVMMGRTPHQGFFAGETKGDLEAARRVMQRTGVWELRERTGAQLSGGERQRVLLARALAQEPRYLLLDEPTSQLDLKYQLEVLTLVGLEAKRGAGALLVLHDLNLAARVCARLLVMKEGALVAEGSPDILNEALLQQVYGAEARVFAEPGTGRPVVLPRL